MSADVTLLGLPVGLLVAWLAYREASRHQEQYGKSPWNISPITWAVIVFFTGLVIGGILLFVARRADRQAASSATATATTATAATATPTLGPTFVRPPPGPVAPPSGRGRMGSVL